MCELLKEWQTLLAGLLAVAAAVWTVFELRRQISLQKAEIAENLNRASETARRKELSIRAHMPDALVEMGDYTRQCAAFLAKKKSDFPRSPTVALAVLKGSIEHLNSDPAEAVFELVSFFQIQNSRLGGYEDKKRSYRKSDLLYDLALLNAYVDRLFDYARNEASSAHGGKPPRSEMTAALRQVVGSINYLQNEEQYAEVVARIERRHYDSVEEG